ncbi:radical SAM/SPASM domain-containing protein [Succinimonas amylolytica]|uniref:radical SAM/SPASM domain-containing protein n=1 Tax=Succinimonas amylolytica TaxID=83769 RepID=UPI0023A906EE
MFVIKGVNKDVFNLFWSYKFRGGGEINFQDRNSIVNSAKKIIKNLIKEAGSDEGRFKPSMYNICIPSRSDWVVYNTLFNTMVRLNDGEYRKLTGKNKSVGNKLKTDFIKNGLWCRKGTNEKSVYLELAGKYNTSLSINKPLAFNLTTTTKCNAKCPYCYEKGVRMVDFPKNKVTRLLDFMESKLADRKNNFLVVNWFGGETLANTSFISDITEGLKARNIDFSSSIITNGSLINEYMVKKQFVDWKVKDIQITIDGLKETYEKTKRYSKSLSFTFESLMEVIGLFADNEIEVHLRLNVSRSNCQEILKLAEYLQSKFAGLKNITYYPAFITGIRDDLTPDEKSNFVKQLLTVIKNPFKVNILSRIDSVPQSHPCMVNDPGSYTVDVNGNIYACEHRVGRPEYGIGSLENFDEDANRKRANFEIPEYCHKCVYLPKCCGGCSVNDETGDERCMIVKYLIQSYLEIIAES